VLKNVYAIAVGIISGLEFGDNAIGMVAMTGIREMIKILTAHVGQTETFFGPAGVGDFCATAFSQQSRNRTLGMLLGLQMINQHNSFQMTGIVTEGLKAIIAIGDLAERHHLNLPLLCFLRDIVSGSGTPRELFVQFLGNVQTQN
jgi:glycerol-3-phosphate dehydrogenase (NAD(P)+)